MIACSSRKFGICGVIKTPSGALFSWTHHHCASDAAGKTGYRYISISKMGKILCRRGVGGCAELLRGLEMSACSWLLVFIVWFERHALLHECGGEEAKMEIAPCQHICSEVSRILPYFSRLAGCGCLVVNITKLWCRHPDRSVFPTISHLSSPQIFISLHINSSFLPAPSQDRCIVAYTRLRCVCVSTSIALLHSISLFLYRQSKREFMHIQYMLYR